MKQYEAVLEVIEKNGGHATLGQLYSQVLEVKGVEWKTKTPFASIRRIVQKQREIYKIKPGLYALRKYKKELESNGIIQETEKNKKSKEAQDFNHSYYQGIILLIGNLKKYKTFLPRQDRNKFFIDKPLGDISTLDNIPEFSYQNLVRRSSTIDGIWFNDRMMPHSFFEVEHSTDIQNSLLKFGDLQDFYSRMIIVADKRRENDLHGKLNYSSFKEIKNRIQFLDYESLVKQYEQVVETTKLTLII